MCNTGPQGRWNRTQRAGFHMLETQAQFIAAALLSGYIFGPVVFVSLEHQIHFFISADLLSEWGQSGGWLGLGVDLSFDGCAVHVGF